MKKITELHTVEELQQATGFNILLGSYDKYYQTNIRGLRIEIMSDCYKVINLNTSELYSLIVNFIEENGFIIKTKNKKRIIVKPFDNLIEGYKFLLERINDSDVKGLGKKENPLFRDKIADEKGEYYSAAFVIKTLIDNGIGHLIPGKHREILHADDQDKRIVKGESKGSASYREHVVPCILIVEHAIAMVVEGSSVEEIANFIKKHLVIIKIDKNQADKINNDLKLKDKMPKGWNFGDNIYARLDEANIAYKLYDDKLYTNDHD